MPGSPRTQTLLSCLELDRGAFQDRWQAEVLFLASSVPTPHPPDSVLAPDSQQPGRQATQPCDPACDLAPSPEAMHLSL